MKIALPHSLLTIVAGTLATLLQPAPPIAPSQWAADHVVLPDGEYAGQKIDLARTPHIVEPLDMLGPDSPVNELAVMKSGRQPSPRCCSARSVIRSIVTRATWLWCSRPKLR